MASESRVKAVKERYSAKLLRQPGVSSVGTTCDDKGRHMLVIGLADDGAELDASLRQDLEAEGVPIKFETVGAFKPGRTT